MASSCTKCCKEVFSQTHMDKKIGCMSLKQALITGVVVAILMALALTFNACDIGGATLPLVCASAGLVSLVISLAHVYYKKKSPSCDSLEQASKAIKKVDWEQKVGCMPAKWAVISALAFAILFTASFYCNYFDIHGMEFHIALAGAAFCSVLIPMIFARFRKEVKKETTIAAPPSPKNPPSPRPETPPVSISPNGEVTPPKSGEGSPKLPAKQGEASPTNQPSPTNGGAAKDFSPMPPLNGAPIKPVTKTGEPEAAAQPAVQLPPPAKQSPRVESAAAAPPHDFVLIQSAHPHDIQGS